MKHCVVASIAWKLKNISHEQAFYSHFEELLIQAKEKGAELCVFPENINFELLSLYHPFKEESIGEILSPYGDAFELEAKRLAKESGMIIVAGSHFFEIEKKIYNIAITAFPDGTTTRTYKTRLTEYEKDVTGLTRGEKLSLLKEKQLGSLICYDSEFSDSVGMLTDSGVQLLTIPYYTDSEHGYYRIRYTGLSRAVEHQIYVAQAGLVGGLGFEPVVECYGQASIIAPPIGDFPSNGILDETPKNQEGIALAHVDFEKLSLLRNTAAVRNFNDRNLKVSLDV